MARLRVHLQPGAARNEVVGWEGDELKVRVNAPPAEGRANRALAEQLAKRLGLAKSLVSVVGGHTSRHKTVSVEGMEEAEVRRRLGL